MRLARYDTDENFDQLLQGLMTAFRAGKREIRWDKPALRLAEQGISIARDSVPTHQYFLQLDGAIRSLPYDLYTASFDTYHYEKFLNIHKSDHFHDVSELGTPRVQNARDITYEEIERAPTEKREALIKYKADIEKESAADYPNLFPHPVQEDFHNALRLYSNKEINMDTAMLSTYSRDKTLGLLWGSAHNYPANAYTNIPTEKGKGFVYADKGMLYTPKTDYLSITYYESMPWYLRPTDFESYIANRDNELSDKEINDLRAITEFVRYAMTGEKERRYNDQPAEHQQPSSEQTWNSTHALFALRSIYSNIPGYDFLKAMNMNIFHNMGSMVSGNTVYSRKTPQSDLKEKQAFLDMAQMLPQGYSERAEELYFGYKSDSTITSNVVRYANAMEIALYMLSEGLEWAPETMGFFGNSTFAKMPQFVRLTHAIKRLLKGEFERRGQKWQSGYNDLDQTGRRVHPVTIPVFALRDYNVR